MIEIIWKKFKKYIKIKKKTKYIKDFIYNKKYLLYLIFIIKIWYLFII